jgi:hypothetical protein
MLVVRHPVGMAECSIASSPTGWLADVRLSRSSDFQATEASLRTIGAQT